MILTSDKFKQFKNDFTLYRGEVVKGGMYSNLTKVFRPTDTTINTMWHPVSDAGDIETFGSDVKTMLRAVVYDTADIEHGDQFLIGGSFYEVIQIRVFQTHREIYVRKVARRGETS